MLEKVTKVFCGSDKNYNYALDEALGQGKLGDLHTNEQHRVLFTKTCHPMDKKT